MDMVPPPKPKRTRSPLTRQSQKANPLYYDSLPTAPPVLYGRQDENIFQFPSVPQRPRNQSVSPNPIKRDDLPTCSSLSGVLGKHSCYFCQPYREDRLTIEPIKRRLSSAIEAMDQLTLTYALLEGLLEQKLATITDEEENAEATAQATLLAITPEPRTPTSKSAAAKLMASETEIELEHSLKLLESFIGTKVAPMQPAKPGTLKRMRERSKSMMEEEMNVYLTKDSHPYVLRRQSTYSDNKSKVSKWTKVKAAFKWERANVPPPTASEAPGMLLPLNNEVERYLKVPINAAGGSSSADSIVSSSSGHFMSDVGGTPGTVSSASSMDDIDANCAQGMPLDSSKSETRCDSRTPNLDMNAVELRKSATDEHIDIAKSPTSSGNMPSKSSSNKSLRRSKVFSDFEVLPEGHVADIKATTNRRSKLPPSPLNLSQVSCDLPQMYSPSLKSPMDSCNQTFPRMRRVHSPGNSSVPSSPSRHSDFFGEFESEDLSSGDFSEPTTPNCKTFQQKEDEVFQRYQLLLFKLDKEFKNKKREFDRSSASNHSITRRGGGGGLGSGGGSGKRSSEEHSPTQVMHGDLMSTAQLEENLTPEFKKKLHKWRAKQQNSTSCSYVASESAASPTAKSQSEHKPKIDWNLWSTGQVKLEGQGLCALPDQKDLPEKFQKKLEQWNKLKSTGGGTNSDNDSLKRGAKHSQSTRRGSDDDRWYKHKPHDKEKLARLKAIVAPDHTSKNIEVKTSDGEVMKFEGISRKFTRKLYEWEKRRGIGPEASTFALLHPGYCPIDVRRINKECIKVAAEHSPTLSRSLSLDSVAPSVPQPTISKQASSLSLNDVNELKEIEDSTDALTDHEYKKFEEPEAVMVEVEEHIHDTASPLVTAHTLVEQQTPIYKYEEVQCNDYCNSRRVQSFESHTNVAPLLGAVKRAEEMFTHFKQIAPDILEHAAMRDCQTKLLSIRHIYPYYSNNLMKPSVLNAISDVQSELGRLTELNDKSPLDEACCQETMEERTHEYIEELHGLYESLECLKLAIQGGTNRHLREIVPDINITSEDGQHSAAHGTCDNSSRDQLFTPIEAPDEQSAASHQELEHETETSTTATVCRGSAGGAVTAMTSNGAKKKLRLRKMGSRQNSKTESDSSDADTQSALETPRRLRRKNFRVKQRSLDDDFRLRTDESLIMGTESHAVTQDDVLYTSLKVKPGEPIEQCQSIGSMQQMATLAVDPTSKVGGFVPPPLPEQHMLSYNTNANVFVKTKRKLFTTIVEPNASEGIAVIEKELESPIASVDEMQLINPLPAIPTSPPRAIQPRPLSLYKSISLESLLPLVAQEELRKCQSNDNLGKRPQVRPPLASDSMRALHRSLMTAVSAKAWQVTSTGISSTASAAPIHKEHLYKKHFLHKSQSATVSSKIEHRISKTNSGSAVPSSSSKIPPPSLYLAPLVLPNKTDNTLPRIQRKLEGKTVTTPTPIPTSTPIPASITITPMKPRHFEFPPVLELRPDRPATPLSERALRLQRARAQFLQSAPTTPMPEPCEQELPMLPSQKVQLLHKSASASTIQSEPLPQQAVSMSTDQESLGAAGSTYGSLPRTVSRSGKISSKLGFAKLASKLRRVKGGSGKKQKEPATTSCTQTSPGGGSALSALCRQTLLADVIALPQVFAMPNEQRPPIPSGSSHSRSLSYNRSRNVLKSQSSPQAARVLPPELYPSHEGLNKSLSEQYVRQLKESDV